MSKATNKAANLNPNLFNDHYSFIINNCFAGTVNYKTFDIACIIVYN